ncbi:MAG: hypothetical protein M1596_04935 [Firmicutes bacterium]|nr:hypothetical protein [Bacillota bacterium]
MPLQRNPQSPTVLLPAYRIASDLPFRVTVTYQMADSLGVWRFMFDHDPPTSSKRTLADEDGSKIVDGLPYALSHGETSP